MLGIINLEEKRGSLNINLGKETLSMYKNRRNNGNEISKNSGDIKQGIKVKYIKKSRVRESCMHGSVRSE